jgi:pyruvate,water dikinase
MENQFVRWFKDIRSSDVGSVGGKNSSLGEMISQLSSQGIDVPDGFATPAEAYWKFLEYNKMKDKIAKLLGELGKSDEELRKVGRKIRSLFLRATFPEEMEKAIREYYRKLSAEYKRDEVDVAVRSSATAEDLPGASFAGQQDSFLNVSGEDELLEATRKCYASLFTDRAIIYRENNGFDHMKVALSAGVQKMVRSDKAGSGVMFSIDTETGFPDVVVINAAWGLGENVVQGAVNPDEYRVFKPFLADEKLKPIVEKNLGAKEKKLIYATKGGSATTQNVDTPRDERNSLVLSDEEILHLARWATIIEKHYGRPMDMEWAKDGETGQLFLVQARPETVQSRKVGSALKTYRLSEKGKLLVKGLAIGQAIASGKGMIIEHPENMDRFEKGAILITGRTDPDWEPIMKIAAGIVTDYGGRTSHAAIVSREMGIPAVVGTENATHVLSDGEEITISCAEGDEGYVYEGKLPFEAREVNLDDVPTTQTQILMNISSPAASMRWWRLPVKGIGLARMEFIVNNIIRIHPMALIHYDELDDKDAKAKIAELTRGYADKTEYFVDHLTLGIAKIAAPRYPDPVIVRMSDFKTNEYADLIGGRKFEPKEENPMLGFRGASRYYSPRYREGFALECRALRRVREEIGFKNIVVMIPFCRTLEEADKVLEVMSQEGLAKGKNDLKVYVMAEIPSNVLLADGFSERFDGFSIGSNDLTQLILGVDRDSAELSHLFDEENPAVERAIEQLIAKAHEHKRKVGLCGQAPSDKPDFAAFLVRAGIDSISLNPDSVITVLETVAKEEAKKKKS